MAPHQPKESKRGAENSDEMPQHPHKRQSHRNSTQNPKQRRHNKDAHPITPQKHTTPSSIKSHKSATTRDDRKHMRISVSHSLSSPASPSNSIAQIENGSNGYKHPKIDQLIQENLQLPPWILSSQLPSLPIIADPEIFLSFFENAHPGELPHPDRFRNLYSPAFKSLAYDGDKKLNEYSRLLIGEMFGEDNQQLCSNMEDDWKSNLNWKDLAISYRIDRYLGVRPRPLKYIHEDGIEKWEKSEKFWADTWEAWWSGICRERELWNEDMRDVISTLQRLIFLKYRSIIDLFSTYHIIDRSIRTPSLEKVTMEHVHVEKVEIGDSRIQTCLISAPPSLEQKKAPPFGYIAIISKSAASSFSQSDPVPDNSVPNQQSDSSYGSNQSLMVYDIIKNGAVSKAIAYANAGIKVSQRPSPPLIGRERIGNDIRQQIFNSMLENWLGKVTPVSKEDILPLYLSLRALRRELQGIKNIGNRLREQSRLKELAMLFWYESILAIRLEEDVCAMKMILCVISYCVLMMPQNHKLLKKCILRHDMILTRSTELHSHSLETASYILKVTKDEFLSGGKFMIHGKEIMTWGNFPDSEMWTAIALQFDKYESSNENGDLRDDHDIRPDEFIDALWGDLRGENKE